MSLQSSSSSKSDSFTRKDVGSICRMCSLTTDTIQISFAISSVWTQTQIVTHTICCNVIATKLVPSPKNMFRNKDLRRDWGLWQLLRWRMKIWSWTKLSVKLLFQGQQYLTTITVSTKEEGRACCTRRMEAPELPKTLCAGQYSRQHS